MYAIHQLDDDLWQLTLPNPMIRSLPAARPVNVYLLTGDAPALINAGHPAQYRALSMAVREAGVEIAQIERVVATSWWIDAIGGATQLTHADLFALSPDLVQPTRHTDWQRGAAKRWREVIEHLRERDEREHPTAEELDAFFDAYLPRTSNRLSFVPVRAGHILRVGQRRLEVLPAPGPDAGHMCLFDAERKQLFSGELTVDGMPERVDSVRDYITSLERAEDRAPEVLLPNRGPVVKWGKFALRRGSRFLSNFLSNAPNAMHNEPTLIEFVERDLGFRPRDLIRYGATVLVYEAFLDELVRSRMVDAEGAGFARRHGVGAGDSRAPARIPPPSDLL